MPTTLADRIIEARESTGLDKAGLVRAVRPHKMTHAALSQLESGKSRSLKAETAIALARATGYRIEYLVLGELPKRAGDKSVSARNVLALSPRAAAAGHETASIRVDFLASIIEVAASQRGWSLEEQALSAVHAYLEIAEADALPAKATILRMLRSAQGGPRR